MLLKCVKDNIGLSQTAADQDGAGPQTGAQVVPASLGVVSLQPDAMATAARQHYAAA